MLALAGCGDSATNTKATISEGSGQHAAGWVPGGHKAAALENQSVCAECHGSDFQGGISRVACTRCHLGGAASIHPQDWALDQTTVWNRHAAYTDSNGLAACANAACHGPDLGGVAESGPSCTSCHLDGVDSMHPQAWGAHAAFLHGDYALINGGAKCANAACHGQILGGVAGSGPACAKCHAVPTHGVLNLFSAPCASCHNATLNIDTKRMMHPFDPKSAPTASTHAAYAKTIGTASCAVAACHGTELKGGVNANCPSCESCHLGGVASVHPVEWGAAIIQAHQNYVHANSTAGCANAACHGPNLTGGTASAPSCTTCHVGGVITISKHPFAAPAVVNHKPFLANTVPANDTSSCAIVACHGPGLTGAGNAPNCVTQCHLGGALAKHPASFGTTTTEVALNHKAFIALNAVNGADGMDGCRNSYCHGSSLTGAAPALGPSCSTTACHQVGSPVVLTNCASCHGKPPTGAAAPNREGAHLEHNALAGVANVCDTCHGGAGTGTPNHFNGVPANVQLATTYNAKSGTAVYTPDADGGTCSKVSCHGGQTTPSWRTIVGIDVNTQCTSCHKHVTVADEFNSYSSGRHKVAIGFSHEILACTVCHDTAKLAPNHFTSLGTAAMEGPASETLNIGPTSIITSYDAVTKSCNAACHPTPPGIERFWLP